MSEPATEGKTKRSRRSEAGRGSLVEVTIAWSTLLKLGCAALGVYLVIRIWPLAELLLLSLVVAIAFVPLTKWCAKKGWPKWVGVLLAALILFGSTALFVVLLAPTISREGAAFVKELPALKAKIAEQLPATGPVRDLAGQLSKSATVTNPETILKHVASLGNVVLESVAAFFVVLVMALYFLVDGKAVYQWLLAFLPAMQRRKMAQAGNEIADVVGHYVVGQVITSALCAVYAFIVLVVLGVPSAALLAVLAGAFDLLPLIGFFLFMIPAAAIALTVSPATAALVGLLYGVYHLIENYFIIPKVYGNSLRLSTLTVLVSCLAAGLVAGVVGVILVLPLVASYPIIERIWLQPYVGRETVQKHKQLDADKQE